jgi:hypothetical protein
MTPPTLFDYDRFINLGGLELSHYVEALLADPTMTISGQSLERMLTELPGYDEYHLVYALTLGGAHSPESFVPYVVQYLGHKQSSVCCTAFNILNGLADKFITQNLIDAVRIVPLDQQLFTDPINGSSHLVGTNTNLVGELLVGLGKRLKEKLQP